MPRVAARSILLLLGSMILSAAPLTGHAAETCDYGNNPNNGLVIFSGTMPLYKDSGIPSWAAPGSFSYIYNRADGNFLTEGVVKLVQWDLLHGSLPSELPGPGYGRVFILRLKAGDYEFTGWSYGNGPSGGAGKIALGIRPLKFTVEAQHAVYLGDFDPVIYTRRFKNGDPLLEPWLTVLNNSSRDLGFFLKKCPGFDVTQIDVKVMDPRPWTTRKN